MRKYSLICIAIALAAAAAGCGPGADGREDIANPGSAALTIHPQQDELGIGDDFSIVARYDNVADKTVKVLKFIEWGHPLVFEVTPDAPDKISARHPDTAGLKVDNAVDFVLLESGETYEETIDLGRYFAFKEEGVYRLKARYRAGYGLYETESNEVTLNVYPGEYDREWMETDISEDLNRICRQALDVPWLQQYLHPELSERVPLVVLKNEMISAHPALEKFGRSVVFLSKKEIEKSGKTAYVEFPDIMIQEYFAYAILRYRAEGIIGFVGLRKNPSGWRVIDTWGRKE